MPARQLNILIRDANYLLVLLPIANFTFIYSKTSSDITLGLILASVIACATFLNMTIGIPDPDEDSTINSLPGRTALLYFSSIAGWIGLWAYSTYNIYEYSGQSDQYADLLFILSVAWAIFLGIHYFLDWRIEGYSNPIFGFDD